MRAPKKDTPPGPARSRAAARPRGGGRPRDPARSPAAPVASAGRDRWVLFACVAAALLWRYRDAFGLPFLNDDYVFLDATAHRSFASLWGHQQLFFHWWRPWSRELHYWALQRAFGPREAVFHAANAVLAIVALALFHGIARALAGTSRAAFATAACAAMAAWALPMLWAAGAQDLWMIVWALAALALWRRDRTGWACAAYALALASKETAAPLPVLFIASDLLLERRALSHALRRIAPAAVLTLAWAAGHPHLGGRWFRHVELEPLPAAAKTSPALAILRTALSLVSLEAWPAPLQGWGSALLAALPAALLLTGGLAWCSRPGRTRAPQHGRVRGVLPFAIAWAACGWLPLLWPALGWHAYYGLFGALGAWLAIACAVPWRPRLALAVTALLTVSAAARDASKTLDWGGAYYQRRASSMVSDLHAMLRGLAPALAPHTRAYFAGLPNNVGMLQGDGPALRTWYRDSTLRAGYFSAYRPQPPGTPGADRFFKLDGGTRLVELVPGEEDVASARAANPDWAQDHNGLAGSFVDAGDYARAREEYMKLARAEPDQAEPAYNVAACSYALGDSLARDRWLAEALKRPVVSEKLRATARASGLHYW